MSLKAKPASSGWGSLSLSLPPLYGLQGKALGLDGGPSGAGDVPATLSFPFCTALPWGVVLAGLSCR